MSNIFTKEFKTAFIKLFDALNSPGRVMNGIFPNLFPNGIKESDFGKVVIDKYTYGPEVGMPCGAARIATVGDMKLRMYIGRLMYYSGKKREYEITNDHIVRITIEDNGLKMLPLGSRSLQFRIEATYDGTMSFEDFLLNDVVAAFDVDGVEITQRYTGFTKRMVAIHNTTKKYT